MFTSVVPGVRCQLCYKWLDRVSLSDHLLSHCSPDQCEVCDEIFTSPEAIGQHRIHKHQQRTCNCHMCGEILIRFVIP